MKTIDHDDRPVALISVVVPVFGEAKNLAALVERLNAVSATIADTQWEYLFINDGSKDDSLTVLLALAAKDPRCRVVDLSRNFGKEIALTAGVQLARGDAVICIDADLQHPPELMSEMVKAWREGSEVVVALRRSSEREPLFRRIGSRAFNRIMNYLSEVEYVAHSTDYRLMDRQVVDALNSIGERARIFRGLVDWLGYKRSYLQFDAAARQGGGAGYSFGKLWTLALNSFTSLSSLPLRFVGYLGVLITVASTLALGWMFTAQSLVNERFFYTPLAKVVVANMLLIGVVMVALGTMSLYIAKIYAELSHRPLFAVRRLVNFDDEARARALKVIEGNRLN